MKYGVRGSLGILLIQLQRRTITASSLLHFDLLLTVTNNVTQTTCYWQLHYWNHILWQTVDIATEHSNSYKIYDLNGWHNISPLRYTNYIHTLWCLDFFHLVEVLTLEYLISKAYCCCVILTKRESATHNSACYGEWWKTTFKTWL